MGFGPDEGDSDCWETDSCFQGEGERFEDLLQTKTSLKNRPPHLVKVFLPRSDSRSFLFDPGVCSEPHELPVHPGVRSVFTFLVNLGGRPRSLSTEGWVASWRNRAAAEGWTAQCHTSPWGGPYLMTD